ncbi:MAG: C10 family peptidase [Prevotella sp.]|nr:C10 family peptidase [Prevotella sp.]
MSSDIAKQNALDFLSSKHSSSGVFLEKSTQPLSSPSLSQVYSDDNIYAFNIDTDGGFVLISASDLTQPVLGYTDSGQFDISQIPTGLQELLNAMSLAISKLESGELECPSLVRSNVSSSEKTAIAPLIQTQWGQNSPFNLQCPIIDGSNAVTGCVATTMSQIMYFFKYPTEATTEIPAYSDYSALPATTFNWDAMTTYYNSAYDTDDSRNAVAELMHYAGQAVQMEYDVSSSGALLESIPPALQNYFGYECGGTIAVGANYKYNELGSFRSYSDLDNLLYNELKDGYPFILSGVSADDYGHAFIVDGYDGNGYYHINWGWNGYLDGYFSLCLLNATNDISFPFYQSAVIGIRPYADGTEENGRGCSIYEINASSSILTRSSSDKDFSLNFTWSVMANLAEDNIFIETNFNLYDSNGNIVQQEICDPSYFSFPSCDGYNIVYQPDIERTASFGKSISDGTYFIKGVYRVYQTTEWSPLLQADTECLKVSISGNKATVTTYPQISLTVNSMEVEGNLRVSNTQQLKVNITNNGSEFYDQLYLIEDNSVNNSPFVLVNEGETTDVYIDYTPTRSGSHTLYLSTTSSSSHGLLDSKKVTILDSTKGMTTLKAEIHTNLENDDNAYAVKYLYSNELTFNISITNTGKNIYDSYVTLIFYANGDYSDSYTALSQTKFNVALEPGETTEYSYTNTEMKAGMQYYIVVQNDEDKDIATYNNLRVEAASISSVTSDDNIEANIYTLYGTVVGRASNATIKETLNTLPKGIYIFKGKKVKN